MMPASKVPISAGWPMRCMPSPSTRPTTSSSSTSATRRPSALPLPLAPLPAALPFSCRLRRRLTAGLCHAALSGLLVQALAMLGRRGQGGRPGPARAVRRRTEGSAPGQKPPGAGSVRIRAHQNLLEDNVLSASNARGPPSRARLPAAPQKAKLRRRFLGRKFHEEDFDRRRAACWRPPRPLPSRAGRWRSRQAPTPRPMTFRRAARTADHHHHHPRPARMGKASRPHIHHGVEMTQVVTGHLRMLREGPAHEGDPCRRKLHDPARGAA